MFGIGSDPFEHQNQNDQDIYAGPANDLVGRIMATEYNLAVQNQGPERSTPGGILGQMIGEFLLNRYGQ